MSDNLKFNKQIMNHPHAYQPYDNYNAIEVPRTSGIPSDYQGVMGVPISFLDKYNPDQFEIVGMDFNFTNNSLSHFVKNNWNGKLDRGYLRGKRLYSRILIQHRKK